MQLQLCSLDERVGLTTLLGGSAVEERRFVYDAGHRIVGEYGATTADLRAEYIWLLPEVGDGTAFGGDDGLGGYMPLAVAIPDGATSKLHWTQGNHLGTPAVTTDASGAIVTPTGYARIGFLGQVEQHADLYYNYYRDYDPTLGRYVQADPIGLGGDVNPYVYAGANPLGGIDPDGLETWKDHCLIDDDGRVRFCDKPIEPYYWEQWLPIGRAIQGCYQIGAKVLSRMRPRNLGFNPFKGKTPKQLEELFKKKGFKPEGPNPTYGKGTFVNPKTGRSYHVDANHPPPKPPHVGVERPRGARGNKALPKSRDYPL